LNRGCENQQPGLRRRRRLEPEQFLGDNARGARDREEFREPLENPRISK
jgi:hypothetical protein